MSLSRNWKFIKIGKCKFRVERTLSVRVADAGGRNRYGRLLETLSFELTIQRKSSRD
jgi:hypothetical protein